MLYNLLSPFKDSFSINLFEYITFRAGIAAIAALFISFIKSWVIHILHKTRLAKNCSQVPITYEERGHAHNGRNHHINGSTPPNPPFFKINSVLVQVIIFSTIWMGVIGFLDDYLKVIKKMKRGLIARYKLAGQISLDVL